MAKKVMMILVAVMLIVGFGIGLVASPFLITQNNSSTNSSTSNSSTDTVWTSIEQRGYINVGTDPSWPPYEELNGSQQIVGFEVDLANAIAAQLNLTVHWHDVSFDQIITQVQNGQLDMGVSGFSITADRLNSVSFTIPHSVTSAQLIMLQSEVSKLHITNGTITSLNDVQKLGIKVGTQDGTTEQSELQAANVNTRSWGSFADAIQDMASANPSVQAVYAETPVTNAWIDQYAAKGQTIEVVYSHPYYPVAFVVAKGSHTLLDQMNGAITSLIADGTVDKLKVQWHAQT